ncbi:methyltransferase N6AMT1-like isoform X2 [Ptychodera flava]|uniref:methyltransferase N6AMT1-like isoform X2 n=1 Tax=Ptychodera flava TaxID=63121 RepID=UPI003969D35C
MFRTPEFSHLSHDDYKHVYEPAEDTFLMLDAIEKEYESLRELRPTVCVEVGCGSGIVITFLASLFKHAAFCMATDINKTAASAAKKTSEQNGVIVDTMVTDLVKCLQPRLNGLVDVLIFNPPYVVTPNEEVGSQGIEASWAGGDNGRQVMDRIFPLVSDLLSKRGVFYLVIIKENKQDYENQSHVTTSLRCNTSLRQTNETIV